ncbi:hypothetical protein RTP6_002478 [Batrachochytrium dendrobatidis]
MTHVNISSRMLQDYNRLPTWVRQSSTLADQEWTHIALFKPLVHNHSRIKVHLVGVHGTPNPEDMNRISCVMNQLKPSTVCIAPQSIGFRSQRPLYLPMTTSASSHLTLEQAVKAKKRYRPTIDHILALAPTHTKIRLLYSVTDLLASNVDADHTMVANAHSFHKLANLTDYQPRSVSVAFQCLYTLLSYAAFGGHFPITHPKWQSMSIREMDMRANIWGRFYTDEMYWSIVLPNAVMVEQLRRIVYGLTLKLDDRSTQSNANDTVVVIVDALHVVGLGEMWAAATKNERFLYGGKQADKLANTDERNALLDWLNLDESLNSNDHQSNALNSMATTPISAPRTASIKFQSVVIVDSSGSKGNRPYPLAQHSPAQTVHSVLDKDTIIDKTFNTESSTNTDVAIETVAEKEKDVISSQTRLYRKAKQSFRLID